MKLNIALSAAPFLAPRSIAAVSNKYSKIGDGFCKNSVGQLYDILRYPVSTSVDECEEVCGRYESRGGYAGFEHRQTDCICLFDQDVVLDTEKSNPHPKYISKSATGPIYTVEPYPTSCYSYLLYNGKHVWDLKPMEMVADFSYREGKGSDLSTIYEFGKGADEAHKPFVKLLVDCANETEVSAGVISQKDPQLSPINANATHRNITFSYDVNKTELAGSDIWNSSFDVLSVCEEVTLRSGNHTITLVKTRQVIDLNRFVEFDTSVNVTNLQVEQQNATAYLSDSLEAKRCKDADEDYAEDNGPLPPNVELSICLFPKGGVKGIQVDEINTMDIIQELKTLSVIKNDVPSIPALTTKTWIPSEKGFRVATRVPVNEIIFSDQQTLTVRGQATMALVSDGQRRLQAVDSVDGDNEAAFDLTIKLIDLEDMDGIKLASTAGYVTSHLAVASLWVVSVLVFSLI